MSKTKLYCYVDETGQDGKQTFFLVSVVITSKDKLEGLEKILEELEKQTGKKKSKWTKTNIEIKKEFIDAISKVKDLKKSIFYSSYPDGKAYTHLTSLSLTKAIFAKEENEYSATVIIDGLTKKDREKVRKELKLLRVKYDTIKGLKDEQSVFLRLADTFAGFIRDYIEEQPYANELFKKLQAKGIVTEV
ncbi:MAG TPA: DUF3800 domain-containing protein [Clostridia bacterium]